MLFTSSFKDSENGIHFRPVITCLSTSRMRVIGEARNANQADRSFCYVLVGGDDLYDVYIGFTKIGG